MAHLGRGLLLGLLICLLVAPGWVNAQTDQGCYVLDRVAHEGPTDIELALYEGTQEDFTMTYLEGATYPGSIWEVHVPQGLANYSQPDPPGTIVMEFTPPPVTWCVGEEKRFIMRGTASGVQGLQHKYTPCYNYGTWGEPVNVVGVDVFASEVMPEGEFAGEGSLRLLHSAFPEIEVDVLFGSGYGPMLVRYYYVLDDSSQPAGGETAPGEAAPPPAAPPVSGVPFSFGAIEIVIMTVIAVIVWLLFGIR